jgi:hypothetical protein
MGNAVLLAISQVGAERSEARHWAVAKAKRLHPSRLRTLGFLRQRQPTDAVGVFADRAHLLCEL